MRGKAILIFCVSLLVSLPAVGQKVALFGGYQLTHIGGDSRLAPLANSATLNGWNASLTGSLAPFFGVTADFSGAYKSGSKLHTYTFGPEVRAHLAGIRPFAHALFGGYTSSGPISNGATNGFVMFYGGGLDVKAAPFVSVRLGQFDWMVSPANTFPSKNNFRYSAGVVLSF
jgi:hypothetical protein